MVVVKEVTNPAVVLAVMEEAWETVKDDSPVEFSEYVPILDENNRWFATYDGEDLVSLFYVHRLNLITWQLHIQFRPHYWGTGISTEHGMACVDEIWSKVGCKKLYALVPSYAKPVLDLAKRAGFKQEGRTKRSFQKDGEIYDQIHIGVYR